MDHRKDDQRRIRNQREELRRKNLEVRWLQRRLNSLNSIGLRIVEVLRERDKTKPRSSMTSLEKRLIDRVFKAQDEGHFVLGEDLRGDLGPIKFAMEPPRTMGVEINMQSRTRSLELKGDHVHPCPSCYEDFPCDQLCAVEPDMVRDDGMERGYHVECAGCSAFPRGKLQCILDMQGRVVSHDELLNEVRRLKLAASVPASTTPARLDADGTAKPLTEIREVFSEGDGRERTLFHGAGDGYVVVSTSATVACDGCDGHGVTMPSQMDPLGDTCPDCNGSGKRATSEATAATVAVRDRVRLLMMASGAYTLDQINRTYMGLADELTAIVREERSTDYPTPFKPGDRVRCILGASGGFEATVTGAAQRITFRTDDGRESMWCDADGFELATSPKRSDGQ